MSNVVKSTAQSMTTIGRAEKIEFPEAGLTNVPAKVDTGAFSSSVWATNIREEDGILYFCLLDSTKELSTDKFEMLDIENSFGHSEVRYGVKLWVVVKGRKVRTIFSLADRSNKTYPVLLGRKLLRRKFIVDVSQGNPISDGEY